VFVRTSTGAEGYVQVRYVVPAQSPEGINAPAHSSAVVDSPARLSLISSHIVEPNATVSNQHFGEWRAVDDRPEPGRYSAAGERLADIAKCVIFQSQYKSWFFCFFSAVPFCYCMFGIYFACGGLLSVTSFSQILLQARTCRF
jgi:hypothetical protein